MSEKYHKQLTDRHVHILWRPLPYVPPHVAPYQCRIACAMVSACGVKDPEDFMNLWSDVLATLSNYGYAVWEKADKFFVPEADERLDYPVFAIPLTDRGQVSLPVAVDDLGQVVFLHTGIGHDGSITSLRGLN